MCQLITQANGTMSLQNRSITSWIAQMYEEIDKISKMAKFNGVNLRWFENFIKHM